MDDMNAFERLVASEVVRAAEPVRPVDDEALYNGVYAATDASKWGFRSMFSATRFVAAGVIVALFGGFVLAGVLVQPEDEPAPAAGSSRSPETTFENLIQLPADIPDSVESGSLDTALGPARWARIVGRQYAIPAFIDPHPAPGGFISVDERELWRSSDLVTWVPEGLPVPRRGGVSLMVADGAYWLTVDGDGRAPATVLRSTDSVDWQDASPTDQAEWVRLTVSSDVAWAYTSEPLGLWRSSDAATWEEIDLSGLVNPGPESIDWQIDVQEPVSSGTVDIVPVTYWVDDLNGLLGIDHEDMWERVDLREQAAGVYAAFDPESGSKLATLTFDEVNGDLQVVDAAAGTLLARLRGVGLDDIGRWAVRGGPWKRSFYLIKGEDLVPIDVPGSDSSDKTIVAGPDGFLAYATDSDTGSIRVWRSDDGRTWLETDPLGDEVVEPAGIERDEFPGLPPETMPTPARDPYVEGSWFLGAEGAPSLSPGVAGLAFEVITELALQAVGERGFIKPGESFISALSPNTVMYSTPSGRDGAGREIWIVTFDDVPA